MRVFLILAAMIILIIPLSSQSLHRFRISGHPAVKGIVKEETETQILIRDEAGKQITIPKDMIISRRPYKTYLDMPGYDQNKNDFYYGLEWGLNKTTDQEKQNFYGWTFFGRAGYDRDHRYALEIKSGLQNMNFTGIPFSNDNSKELYIPVIFSLKKYLTRGRHLLYISIGHGYSWSLGPVFREENMGRSSGPIAVPGIGVRRIGRYGQDYELQLGWHLQKTHAQNKNSADLFSDLEMVYHRWSLSYGIMF